MMASITPLTVTSSSYPLLCSVSSRIRSILRINKRIGGGATMSETSTEPQVNPVAKRNEDKRPKSNWAQITSAWVGVIAIVGVGWQVHSIRKNFRESAARQVYMSYSEASLRTPELVEPVLEKLKRAPQKQVK